MKIAFWSEESNAGTTFNLSVTACAAVFMHPISVAVVSGGYHDEKLEKKFFRAMGGLPPGAGVGAAYDQRFVWAAEEQVFFLTRGVEYLLQKEQREDLTEMAVKSNMRQIVRDRMYFLPSSPKSEQEWWHQDSLFVRMDRIMDALESYFDVVFVDCGSRRDDYAQKIVREAGVCVWNMDQESQNIGAYYQSSTRFQGEIFFLLANYFADALYNRENLQRVYRMEESRLGAIPYNPRLQAESQMGRTHKGVKRCIDQGETGSDAEFTRELARSTNLILKLAGVIR